MGRSKTIEVIQQHVAKIVKALDRLDHYRILELGRDATTDQVNENFDGILGAYRKMLQHQCPGRLRSDIFLVCKRLGEAKRTLGDPELRAVYDQELKADPKPRNRPLHPIRLKAKRPAQLSRLPKIPTPEPALETNPGLKNNAIDARDTDADAEVPSEFDEDLVTAVDPTWPSMFQEDGDASPDDLETDVDSFADPDSEKTLDTDKDSNPLMAAATIAEEPAHLRIARSRRDTIPELQFPEETTKVTPPTGRDPDAD